MGEDRQRPRPASPSSKALHCNSTQPLRARTSCPAPRSPGSSWSSHLSRSATCPLLSYTHTHAQSAGPYPSPRPPCRPRLTPTTPRKWTADPKSERVKKTPRGDGLDDHGQTSPHESERGQTGAHGWSHRGRKPLRLIPFHSSQQGLAVGRQPDQATVGPEEWGDGVGRPR